MKIHVLGHKSMLSHYAVTVVNLLMLWTIVNKLVTFWEKYISAPFVYLLYISLLCIVLLSASSYVASKLLIMFT